MKRRLTKKEIDHQYYIRHREEKTAYTRKYEKRNRKKIKSRKRERQYGITSLEFEILLKKQNGKCYICGIAREEHKKIYKMDLTIDHNHKTGKIRGILCIKHNRALGFFGDDLPILERAVLYLKRHHSRENRRK